MFPKRTLCSRIFAALWNLKQDIMARALFPKPGVNDQLQRRQREMDTINSSVSAEGRLDAESYFNADKIKIRSWLQTCLVRCPRCNVVEFQHFGQRSQNILSCSTCHTVEAVPQHVDFPPELRNFSVQVRLALRPVVLHQGTFRRHRHGYDRKDELSNVNVLKCAQCIQCACVRTTGTTTLKKCAWECASVYALRWGCHSSTVDSKFFFCKRLYAHRLVSQHQVALCLFSVARAFLFRTCAVKSGEVGCGECRHNCDDEEEFHQEHLAEGDHVHDDHDDHCCIGIWKMTGQVFPFSPNKLLVFKASPFTLRPLRLTLPLPPHRDAVMLFHVFTLWLQEVLRTRRLCLVS